jgi:hypothetical protein
VGLDVVGLLLLAVAVVALSVSPNTFLGLTLLVIGTESVSEAHPLAFGGAQLYSVDVLLGVVLLRAVLPREHAPPAAPLRAGTKLVFAALAALMLAEALRAELGGYPTIPILRILTPVAYAIGFYFGLGRIVREPGFDLDRSVRALLLAGLALLAYFAATRFANTPFENETNPDVGHLGTVVTTAGVLRRDYGFASAFIVYPALGLGGAAYLLHGARRQFAAAVVAGLGILATLLTLIRGEIFGLAFGLVLIAAIHRSPRLVRMSRAPVVLASIVVVLAGSLGFWVTSPATARAVVERALPGVVPQSSAAEENVRFREQAVSAGFAAASQHPFGVGLVPDQALLGSSGVAVGYAAHSGVAWIAPYAGWAGIVLVGLALLAVFADSFALPSGSPWLHPFFAAALVMLTFYTVFDADGLLGQGWVTALAALLAALRFNAAGSPG